MKKNPAPQKNNSWVSHWLFGICLWIIGMVLVGGVTRLTNSGLSITEWAPILGTFPPLHQSDWLEVFSKYQMTPQFQLLNPEMNLTQFKWIFFWEYLHRLLARGLAFYALLPGIYGLTRQSVSRSLFFKVLFGIGLGGLQGLLGWWMVKSGLVDRTSVSPYRLTAHLSLALLILFYFSYIYEKVRDTSNTPAGNQTRRAWPYVICTIALSVQIIFGGMVAGMKAGYGYPSYPKMLGEWIPKALQLSVQDPTSLHFTHRWWALVVLISFIATFFSHSHKLRSLFGFLTVGVMAQFVFGIFTAVYQVPLPLGVLHQTWAAVLIFYLGRFWARQCHA